MLHTVMLLQPFQLTKLLAMKSAKRKFLIELENPIYLLQNDIYFPNGTKKIYSENEILNLSNEELRKIFVNNGYGIFGGIGFAGLNENFNYNHGIYRDAPLNREKEIQYSKQVEKIHEKLKLVASDKKIYFSTFSKKY